MDKKRISQYSKHWYKKNSTKVKQRVIDRKLNHPENYIFIRAKASAKKRSLKFSITLQDIVIPKYCPILGIKLQMGKGKENRGSAPSLDRINNSKGYVPGNVEVISFRANRIKNDASKEEIQKLYKHYFGKV
jgi:hypothetical protein